MSGQRWLIWLSSPPSHLRTTSQTSSRAQMSRGFPLTHLAWVILVGNKKLLRRSSVTGSAWPAMRFPFLRLSDLVPLGMALVLVHPSKEGAGNV